MKGLVLRSTGSWYTVKTEKDGEIVECRLKGKFKQNRERFTNPIAVGDRVEVEMEEEQDTGVITKIYPRENYLIRMSPRMRHGRHILAANLDRALLVVTIRFPRFKPGFVDRFLVSCEAYHVPATLVFNKKDLYTPEDMAQFEEWKSIYEPLGYPCILVSAAQKEGLEELKKELKGHTTLLAGHSGVGKSTLINAMYPYFNVKTGELSKQSGKGKHTTTFAEMFEIKEGGYIIDTPGVKEMSIADLEPGEVAAYFPEMRERMNRCRFSNCLHINEPGCAVIEAVRAGEIAFSRYENYLHIVFDLQEIKKW